MKFPAFWTRVQNERGTVSARGWSEESLVEATNNANQRLHRILAWLRSDLDQDLDRYSYLIDNVICEEVIDRIVENERETAVVSRNAYGALILNSARLMFVDIDFPIARAAGCLFGWLLKKPPVEPTPQEVIFEKLKEWQNRNPELTLRVYRTSAGIRVMLINRSFEVVNEQAIGIMKELGSDALYLQLCQSQSCFRARLTPKPWRIGLANPPKRFPFEAVADQQAFSGWHQKYLVKARSFNVCEFLGVLGFDEPLADHRSLIELHDQFCCSEQALPLA